MLEDLLDALGFVVRLAAWIIFILVVTVVVLAVGLLVVIF